MHNKKYYTDEQLAISKRHRKDSKKYGNIDNVDPRLNSAEVMNIISKGRSPDSMWGNVDDMVDSIKSHTLLGYISLGRGSDPKWGNIDALVPLLITANFTREEIQSISERRGSVSTSHMEAFC